MTKGHQVLNLAGVFLPFLGFLAAILLLWDAWVDWTALAIMVVMYVVSVMGVTLGFHRLLTHRSFATYKPVQYALAIIGSMAVQGPVMNWVADHRKHHAHTDQEGDPHTPHGHGSGFKGAVTGLWYAHMGWLFEHSGTTDHERYARDLYDDRGMQVIHRTFPLWVALGIAIPAAAGYLVTGTWRGAFEAALWGGAGADLPRPPHDVVDQLRLPLLRHAALRRRGPLDQRLLARPVLDGRVLAPQPPHVPALRLPRAEERGSSIRRATSSAP